MVISKVKLYSLMYGLLAFLLSLYIAPFYVNGDQFHYRGMWDSCFFGSMSNEAQRHCYSSSIGSSEPIYYYIVRLAQEFFNKDLFISAINGILFYLIAALSLREYQAVWHRHIFLLLVLSNYYIMVLMFAAERLKFAFLFLLCAAFFSKKLLKGIFALITILTHSQMLILVAAFLTQIVLYAKIALYKKIGLLFAGVAGLSATIFVLRNHILAKYESVSGMDETDIGIMGALKASVFIVFAAISTRRFQPLIFGSPLILSSYVLGSGRIIIMIFFLYIGYVLSVKKKMDLLMLASLLFCTYKSIDFVKNILTTGSGYL